MSALSVYPRFIRVAKSELQSNVADTVAPRKTHPLADNALRNRHAEICSEPIGEDKFASNFDPWGILETFLLHFRNLIEVFGKKPDPRRDDLSILKPEVFWRDEKTRPAADKLASLHRPDLWTKYEDWNVPEKISRYLHHCTEQRIEPKEWRVSEMCAEVEPLAQAFEALLLDRSRSWNRPPAEKYGRVLLGSVNSSTATPGKPILLRPFGNKTDCD